MNASSAITHGGRKGLALGIANGDLIAHTRARAFRALQTWG